LDLRHAAGNEGTVMSKPADNRPNERDEPAATTRSPSCRWSVDDYPPGPRDDLHLYPVMWIAVENGTMEPTNEVRNGQRVFRFLAKESDIAARPIG
jgi:hypothetical protein